MPQANCKWHWNNVSVQCNCNCTMQQFVCYAIVFVCWQMQMQISPLDMPPFTFKSTGNSGRQTKHGAVQVKMLFHGDFWWFYNGFMMILWSCLKKKIEDLVMILRWAYDDFMTVVQVPGVDRGGCCWAPQVGATVEELAQISVVIIFIIFTIVIFLIIILVKIMINMVMVIFITMIILTILLMLMMIRMMASQQRELEQLEWKKKKILLHRILGGKVVIIGYDRSWWWSRWLLLELMLVEIVVRTRLIFLINLFRHDLISAGKI